MGTPTLSLRKQARAVRSELCPLESTTRESKVSESFCRIYEWGYVGRRERERERATVPADCALLSIMMPGCSWLSCYTQGKYLDAERLYKRSRDIQEKVLGPRHPDVAVVLNNSAVLLEERVRDVCTEKSLSIYL